MATENALELRRQLEEPPSGERRNYPHDGSSIVVALIDTPYYPPYVADTPHVHNFMEIGICLAGAGQVTLGERTFRFSAGSVIVAPRGVYHSEINAGDPLTHWRYLVLREDMLLRSTSERCRAVLAPFVDSIGRSGLFLESASGASELMRQLIDLRRQEESEAALEEELYALLLLLLLARESTRTGMNPPAEPSERHLRQPIEPALTYVYNHYKEDIRVSELARCCSMSVSYFRKQFLRIMRTTPLEYVNQFRVHRAMNLLRTTGDSIQNIAVRAGFSSVAAFNRNFRQYAGVSPSQWRRSRQSK